MTPTSEGKIGKYEIVRVLGRGGMGEVLLAEDRALGRRVAIKRPFKSALDDGLARFQIEARAATLNHRNIPAVYELGQEDGLPFIAMEYVEGEPLDQIIASGRELDLIVKLGIIEQVCSALDHAHRKGIIHRDIKPANVIVQPDGIVKIIDFGIAKIQSMDGAAGPTATSQIIGSLHYIAPERFRGETIDGRADIFSTGVMLYLLLTGTLPFPGAEATAAYKIVNESHIALSTHMQGYPPALDAILERALAKSPSKRYASAEDFAEALHEVIDELKRNRVSRLYDDAERLSNERRFEPALEMLNEAMNLDPANTEVRKLRRIVREQQDKVKRGENLRLLLTRADEAIVAERYAEALSLLKEASALDPGYAELREKIQTIEEKKRASDKANAALANAEAIKDRDINGAVKILERALAEDPSNFKLLTAHGTLCRQAQSEAQHAGLQELFEKARTELAARCFPQVEELLAKAKGLDPTHPEIDKLSSEMARVREQEERRRILDEIQRRVYELVQNDQYEQASELVNRAIDKLPSESTLHRLKAEVSQHARQLQEKRVAEDVISRARELSATAPDEALALVRQALDQMPDEERLVAYEKALQQQVAGAKLDDVYQSTVRQAREQIDAHQYEGAIATLEAYQLQHGSRREIDDFLGFARDEFAKSQRSATVERCLTDSRVLIREGRSEEAMRCLEAGVAATDHPAIGRVLAELRENQQSSTQAVESLLKRVAELRDKNQIDEAIGLLRQQLASTPNNAQVAEQLNALVSGQGRQQTIFNAIASARDAALQGHFSSGIESLQAVQQGYGNTDELTRAIEDLQFARAAHADEAVGKSIDLARTALAGNDAHGAFTVLTSVASMLEFVDVQKQADWQATRHDVQTALSSPGRGTGLIPNAPPPPFQPHGNVYPQQPDPFQSSGTVAYAPPPPPFVPAFVPPPSVPPPFFPNNAQLPLGPPAAKKPSGAILWIILALCLAGIGGGAFLYWKLHPSGGYIRIAKAPVGSEVSIDHGTPQVVDSSGQFKAAVTPGDRLLEVSKDGYDSFSEKITVEPGATVNYPSVILTRTPVAGTSGKLVPQGNIPDFRLTIDQEYRGLLHSGDSVPLAPGSHTVLYTNTDNSDSQQHTVTISANQNLNDPFSLKVPKTSQAKLSNPAHTKPHDNEPTDPANPIGATKPDNQKSPSKTDSSGSDLDKIQAAHDRFEAAYASKKIDQLKAEWIDIGKDRTEKMEDLYKRADIVKISEKCGGEPAVKGDEADWPCTEIVQLNDKFFGPYKKTLIFAKQGPKWVLKDK